LTNEALQAPLWPMVVYFVATLAVAAGMIGGAYLLGAPARHREKADPYESGVASTGGARLRVPVRFYLVAVLFVVFDLEAAFIFVWALVVREAGWAGYAGMGVFLLILLAALVYEWREGALDWTATSRRPQRGS
jgi:NADH-quinone oxidoreductase subunit A